MYSHAETNGFYTIATKGKPLDYAQGRTRLRRSVAPGIKDWNIVGIAEAGRVDTQEFIRAHEG